MKKLLMISSIALSTSLMATGGWKVISENFRGSNIPEDIFHILASESSTFAWLRHDHVNRELAGVKIDPVAKLEFTTKKLRWEGETKCTPEDPRLETKTLAGTVTRASGGTEGFEDIVINGDPCQ